MHENSSSVPVSSMDRPPSLTDEAILDMQRFLNDFFRFDLSAPVYLVRAAQPKPGVIAEFECGFGSAREKPRLADWSGPGYLVRLHDTGLSPPEFHSLLAHKIAHCFDPRLVPPTDCWCENMDHNIQELVDEHLKSSGLPSDETGRWHFFHDAKFWRTALHVAHRLTEAGKICHWDLLGVPADPIFTMLATVYWELDTLSQLPLRKLAGRPVSGAFNKLFQRVRTDVAPIRFTPIF